MHRAQIRGHRRSPNPPPHTHTHTYTHTHTTPVGRAFTRIHNTSARYAPPAQRVRAQTPERSRRRRRARLRPQARGHTHTHDATHDTPTWTNTHNPGSTRACVLAGARARVRPHTHKARLTHACHNRALMYTFARARARARAWTRAWVRVTPHRPERVPPTHTKTQRPHAQPHTAIILQSMQTSQ